MLKATKIRLYPDVEQIESLSIQFDCVRFVWNKALEMKSSAWRERQESLSCTTIKSMLPVWKAGEYPWLKEADSQALQESIRNLDKAYTRFFQKKSRHPRFKRKSAARQSIQYPQRVKVAGSLIYLPKVGWTKAVIHREIVGAIRTVTVSRDSAGHYFAAILTEDGVPEAAPLTHLTQVEGIDLGLKDAVADSLGNKSGNPKYLLQAAKNLRRKQQALSRKIEAAKVRCKQAGRPATDLKQFFGGNIARDRKKVAAAHARVRNARSDWQHKLSKRLADENQAVSAETLNIKGMMQNRKMARAIADVGWSELLAKIDYKLKRRGGYLMKIDRWFPSTKMCSCCGAIREGLKLSDRTWVCTCGAVHDRDTNAARNIRAAGIIKLKAAGLSVSAHGGCVTPACITPAAACEVGSLRL